jgi:hypothetical protein
MFVDEIFVVKDEIGRIVLLPVVMAVVVAADGLVVVVEEVSLGVVVVVE